jgi:alkyl hydroperoxide reductase subunit F
MSRIAKKVYVVSRSPWKADGLVADAASGITNIETRTRFAVLDIVGEDKVEGLRIKEMTSGEVQQLKVQGVFLEIGLDPNSGFVRGLLPLTGYGEVMVDCECRTTVKGVFAAGDVTQVRDKQMIVAAGEGAKAALSAYEYLTAL